MRAQPSDINSPAFIANPYPFYESLRAEGELVPFDERIHLVSAHYDIVDHILKSRHFGREGRSVMTEAEKAALPPVSDLAKPLVEIQKNWIIFRDPPYHTRVRGMVKKAFTPKMVHNLQPHIQEITDYLIDAVVEQGHMDVIADFALPLPVTVIAEMMGVPPDDRDKFRQWSQYLLGINDIIPPSEEQKRKVHDATLEVVDYFEALLAKKRAQPQDDLLSHLIAVEEAGDTLSEQELIATSILLLVAGFETTTNLIGNGLLLLLQHPEQMQLLRDDPALAPRAVEEMLRYEAPVQFTGRLALQDVEIAGHAVRRLQGIGLLIGGANRDPKKFSRPAVFDITRDEAAVLSFGGGIHYCLGAPLARVEGYIAFNTLLHRLANLQLVHDELPWRNMIALRGLETLPIRFDYA